MFYSKLGILMVFFTLTFFDSTAETNLPLMPYPKEVKLGSGKFRLDKDFTLSVKNSDEKVFAYATRFLRRLDERTGLFFSQDFITAVNDSSDTQLEISFCKSEELKLGIDESYQLKITPGKIDLSAESNFGAMHGLETLLQLLMVDEDGYYFPAVEINDEPRFPWRGLLIDICRHFMPMDVLKRNIDGMAAVKMNVLHLHLSEDQGFRIESKVYPKLQELGSDGLYYTQTEMKEIIKYAGDRGIRIIPEFDVPGHTTSWFVGYPELASAPGPYQIERNWGVMDPTINPTKEETYEFLDNLFGEMTALFPDEYFHIGGDENNGKQWDANDSIQEFMKENNIKDNHDLQAYF
ncbi:beta-glycosyl hydrolase, partial [hydrothermal vent metagenome]